MVVVQQVREARVLWRGSWHWVCDHRGDTALYCHCHAVTPRDTRHDTGLSVSSLPGHEHHKSHTVVSKQRKWTGMQLRIQIDWFYDTITNH